MNIVKGATAIRAIITAAVTVPVFLVAMLMIMKVTAPIFDIVGPTTAPGGQTVDSNVIAFGDAHLVLGLVGFLGIPLAVGLMLFLSGKLRTRRRPQRRRP